MTAPMILQYFQAMTEKGASDLYLTVGFPPSLRVDSQLIPLRDTPLTVDELNEIIGSILTNRQRRDFEAQMELNTSLDVGRFGRFRVNALRQRQFPALVIRRIISKIPTFEELHLPENPRKTIDGTAWVDFGYGYGPGRGNQRLWPR